MTRYWNAKKVLAVEASCGAKTISGSLCGNTTAQGDTKLAEKALRTLGGIDIVKVGMSDLVKQELKDYATNSLCLRNHRLDKSALRKREKEFREIVQAYIKQKKKEKAAEFDDEDSSVGDTSEEEEMVVERKGRAKKTVRRVASPSPQPEEHRSARSQTKVAIDKPTRQQPTGHSEVLGQPEPEQPTVRHDDLLPLAQDDNAEARELEHLCRKVYEWTLKRNPTVAKGTLQEASTWHVSSNTCVAKCTNGL